MNAAPAAPYGSDFSNLSANSGAGKTPHQSAPVLFGNDGAGFRRSIRAEPAPAAPQERISHKFQPSSCPRCSEITLHGMVAEGYLAHLDPTPLDDASEARALVAGRVTWHMTIDREVTWRTSTKIAHRPAGNHRDYAVFAEHRCSQPIATSIDDWAWSRPSTTTPEEPQF